VKNLIFDPFLMVPLTFDAIYSKTMKQLFWTFLLGLSYITIIVPHDSGSIFVLVAARDYF